MTTETAAAPAAPAAIGAPAAPAAPENAAPIVAPVAADGALTIGEEPAAEPAAAGPATVAYEGTGDVGLDMALEFVGNLGLGPDDPAMAAAMNGDFAMLKGKLSGMGDKAKGWERFIALAEKSHTATAEARKAQVAKDTEAIHNVVGGAEAWAAVSKWAGANAEPAERVAVNEALSKGGMVGKAMAAYLHGLYTKAQGTTVQPGQVVNPAAAGRADPVGPLTAAQYAQEAQALRAKMGYNMDGSQAYQALQARRMAGRRAGI